MAVSGSPAPRKRRHILRWVSLAVVIIVLGALVTAYYKYRTISESIHRVAVTDLGNRPPVYSTSSENIRAHLARAAPDDGHVDPARHDGAVLGVRQRSRVSRAASGPERL